MSTSYVAVVRVGTRDQIDVDLMMAMLVDCDPALGAAHSGWLEVRINLPANSLAQACKSALAVVGAATGTRAVACEVMTASEFDDRYRLLAATEHHLERRDGPRQ
jgi:hypothetical protein